MLFPRKRKEVGDKICAQILLLIRQTNPFGVCYRSGVAYLTLSHSQDLNINPPNHSPFVAYDSRSNISIFDQAISSY